jgi:iron-sulfur cluster insertion protein
VSTVQSTDFRIDAAPRAGHGLTLAESAAKRLAALAESEGRSVMLRVAVDGGGCSGFQYGFTFDENEEEGDTCVETRGVKLLVDPMSFQYLAGAEIDYKEDLEGAQFVIRNPNATTTCAPRPAGSGATRRGGRRWGG